MTRAPTGAPKSWWGVPTSLPPALATHLCRSARFPTTSPSRLRREERSPVRRMGMIDRIATIITGGHQPRPNDERGPRALCIVMWAGSIAPRHSVWHLTLGRT